MYFECTDAAVDVVCKSREQVQGKTAVKNNVDKLYRARQ